VPSDGAAGAVAVSLGVVVAVVVVVVVVDVVLLVEESPLPPLPPHAAVSVLRAITAAMPAVVAIRRGVRVSVMVSAPFVVANPSPARYPPCDEVKHDRPNWEANVAERRSLAGCPAGMPRP
jgi:hypothetical protein